MTINSPDGPLDDEQKPATGGKVPNKEDGVGVGAGNEPNTFEPEEDPEATAQD
ncbi:MAG: hypothetical protein JWO49_770 [Arthrobacter sp.]|nr:hypothetical protein [Arthrobacter sp.]MCU1549117.1 hypothetical protein [Arthrobacter sp.]